MLQKKLDDADQIGGGVDPYISLELAVLYKELENDHQVMISAMMYTEGVEGALPKPILVVNVSSIRNK